jgi:uncharacterized coiled-coil protein SlyX
MSITNKASGFGTMLVMATRTTSLEDKMANLTRLVEGLSTSLKVKYHEIAKLMNKLESMNEGGQALATKVMQENHIDIVEDSIIKDTRNICGNIDSVFTMNQLK